MANGVSDNVNIVSYARNTCDIEQFYKKNIRYIKNRRRRFNMKHLKNG